MTSFLEETDFGMGMSESVWTRCVASPLDDGTWVVHDFYVPPSIRNFGFGRKTFERMLFWADTNRITLVLNPSPFDEGLDEAELVRFYSKYGFHWVEGRHLMSREPQEPGHYY